MALLENKVDYEIVDKKIHDLSGGEKVMQTYATADSTLYDAVLLVSNQSPLPEPIIEFIENTYKHYKPLAFALTDDHSIDSRIVKLEEPGVYDLGNDRIQSFIDGIAKGRFWER